MRKSSGKTSGVHDVAVVDVGSNSVRLVVYRVEGRDFTPILNDRVAAGLGRELGRTGELSEDGMESTLAAARRFKLFLDARGVSEVLAVGTAAVREARNAAGFLTQVEQALGAKVKVLSGEEEGRYAALGVLAGNPDAVGVAADFGGASLELAPVANGEVGKSVTLSLGALPLAERAAGVARSVRDFIDESLAAIDIEVPENADLHAVGGAWRNFAKIVMLKDAYPLTMLQGYRMEAGHATDLARAVSKMSPATISRMSEVSRRRSDTMPVAALVLERLVKRFKFRSVVISAYGLREGLLLESLSDHVRELEPLGAASEAMARRAGAELAFGRELETWAEPLFEALGPMISADRDRKLFVAACRLADIGAGFHPDHRAELAARQLLYSSLPFANHAERVFLALTIYHRYAGRKPGLDGLDLDAVLVPEMRQAAQQLGLTLRLAGSISARAASLLRQSEIAVNEQAVCLKLTRAGAELATEVVDKRLAQLAEALGRGARIEAS